MNILRSTHIVNQKILNGSPGMGYGKPTILREFDCNYNKVASAMIVHHELLELIAEEKKHTFISTGMSTLDDIEKAVDIFKNMNVLLN